MQDAGDNRSLFLSSQDQVLGKRANRRVESGPRALSGFATSQALSDKKWVRRSYRGV
jgi:hypothetical protein